MRANGEQRGGAVIDPRPGGAARQLAGVGRIVAFCSAKGGVGKSFCAAAAGVFLAGAGRSVGLLDLDLASAAAHIFLGVPLRLPQEDRGVLPLPVVPGLSLMSAAVFTRERGLALRGGEVSDAILELLCVTRWGSLDALLVDMPPGIGEEVLDLARLAPRLEAVVVSSPSEVSVRIVGRLLGVLDHMRVPVAGVLANMVRDDAAGVREMARSHGVHFAAEVPWDPGVEAALGDPQALCGLAAARAAGEAVLAMLGRPPARRGRAFPRPG
jgi:ATP-binding protein involved in chromosome partitioning